MMTASSIAAFGITAKGEEVSQITLNNGCLSCQVLTYGAILRTLFVPNREGRPVDVGLGYDTLKEYEQDTTYLGATVGRSANRIAKGKFTLNGKDYVLACNNGNNHLHGGETGFTHRVWSISRFEGNRVELTLFSPDGEDGYPGNLMVKVTYELADAALNIRYWAQSDEDTLCNLTNHSYFNLGGVGSGDILGHRAQIYADAITEVDDELIPTGNRPSVAGTPFDFRSEHTIGERLCESFTGYDHNFIFANALMGVAADIELPHVATFKSDVRTMEVYTDQPGAQLYTGNFLDGKPDFKGGVARQARHAFCFETQNEPDYLRLGGEPLRAGNLYHTVTVFRFPK